MKHYSPTIRSEVVRKRILWENKDLDLVENTVRSGLQIDAGVGNWLAGFLAGHDVANGAGERRLCVRAALGRFGRFVPIRARCVFRPPELGKREVHLAMPAIVVEGEFGAKLSARSWSNRFRKMPAS